MKCFLRYRQRSGQGLRRYPSESTEPRAGFGRRVFCGYKINTRNNMKITIQNVANASDLSKFDPVSGEWFLHIDSKDRSIESVIKAVTNWMDAGYQIDVRVFHADGREITSEIPSEGTFLATRL